MPARPFQREPDFGARSVNYDTDDLLAWGKRRHEAGAGMVRTLTGDLFQSKAQTLVNAVNCVGVMGRGIALGFRERFPDMYHDYVARCTAKQVRMGEPYLFGRPMPPWILKCPTKDSWRSVSRLSDILDGLEYLERHYREWGINSLAVPALGCGEGQLEWRVVGPALCDHLSRLGIPVELYTPRGVTAPVESPAGASRDALDVEARQSDIGCDSAGGQPENRC